MIRLIITIAITLSLFIGTAFAVEAPKRDCYELDYVMDGDTVVIKHLGQSISVRMVGIDTPESRFNKRAEMQARSEKMDVKTIIDLGKKSKEHLEKYIGNTVCLEYDENTKPHNNRDQYGRLLAYVYRPDGLMLQDLMLSDGYAFLLTMYPLNEIHMHRFYLYYEHAKKNKLGLFGQL